MKFADRIKELRVEKGLTQAQLGAALKINEATVQSWEHGRNETDFEMLIEIADFFKVTVDFLLGRKGFDI